MFNLFNRNKYEGREIGDTYIEVPYNTTVEKPQELIEFSSLEEYQAFKNRECEEQIEEEKYKRKLILESLSSK